MEQADANQASANNETLLAPVDIALAKGSTPFDLLKQAVLGGASVETIDRMTTLYERWKADWRRDEFAAAFAAAKAELPVLKKNRQVGFDSRKAGAARTSYWHADLAEIVGTVTPILAKHGLWFRWKVTTEPKITVICVIGHRLGHVEEGEPWSDAPDQTGAKNAIQAKGSTTTYLERYSLMAALGLAAAGDDDDGNATDDTPISILQVSELEAALKDAQASVDRFKKYYNLEKLAQLPARLFDDAVQRIENFKAKAKEEREQRHG